MDPASRQRHHQTDSQDGVRRRRAGSAASLTDVPQLRKQPPAPGAGPSQERTPLSHAIAIARRNLVLLLVCITVVPAAALVFSLTQNKEYTASASLLFRDPGLDQKLFGSSFFEQAEDPTRAAATNLRLVALREVAERTARSIDRPGMTADVIENSVKVSPEGESDIIAVEAVAESPQLAARIANTFARKYIAFRREADRAKVREAQQLVQARLDELSPEELVETAGRSLRERSRELEILAALQTGNAELVQAARPPEEASSPQLRRNVAIGIFLGLLLGVGLALLREQLDRRVKDLDDVAGVFDLPVLATIPESRAIARGQPGLGLSSEGSQGDAFLMLRTNLRYFNIDHEVRSILVTSAGSLDGKTTVSWGLAVAEARAGKKVLFIEGDMRRPTVASQLGLSQGPGLSLVLAGAFAAGEALQKVLDVDVLVAGPQPPNPAELMESQRMRELVHWGETHYDRVVIDSAPAAVVADAIPLVSEVTGVVVVVRLGRSRQDAAERLRDQLVNIDAPILGVVVNSVPERARSHYYPAERPAFVEPVSAVEAERAVEAKSPRP
jgi:polysaccharide biosynthesis transport protein